MDRNQKGTIRLYGLCEGEEMKESYSWLEIANMPLCCMCCGSRKVDQKKDICLSCGSTEGLWSDERSDKEYGEHTND
jgi:hypothetical protein